MDSATNQSLIYAAASAGYPALYESQDGGTTWNPAAAGLGVAGVAQIVPDPTNGSVAYALAPVATAAFATAINPTGSGLVYSTYLGGSGNMYGYGIAAQSSGDAFVTGYGIGTYPATSTTPQVAFVVRISNATASCAISVTAAAQTVYSNPTTLSYPVVAPSGCSWTASSNQPWAAIAQGASGSGSAVVFVALSANTTGAVRTAALTIGGQTVPIAQAPSSCWYSVSPSSVSVGANGSPVQTAITTGAGCPWSVVNNHPFAVAISAGASGSGSGTVSLTIGPAAPQTTRTLSINIGTATLTISQSGLPISKITNSATGLQGPLAPGELISVFGTNLGPAAGVSFAVNSAGMVSTDLAGTQVLFGSVAAPILYTSATQINAIVPYEMAGQSQVTVQAQYQGAAVTQTVQVVTASPGAFTLDASGSGSVVAANQDGTINGPSNPAAKGSYVTIYFTGGGQTNPAGVTGSVTGAILKWLTQSISVTVGSQPAMVSFDGSAPTLVDGVDQLNIQLSPSTPSGSQPIVITMGGLSSPSSVTLAVQ